MRIVRFLPSKTRLGARISEAKPVAPTSWPTVRRWCEATYVSKSRATRTKVFATIAELESETESPHQVEPGTIANLIARWQSYFNRSTTINSKLRVLRTVLLSIGTKVPECRLSWEAGDWWVREDDDWIPTKRKHLTPEEVLDVLDQADAEASHSDIGLSLDGSPAKSIRGRQPQSQRWYAHRRRALVWLLAATGLRASEALCARDIDFDGEILEVTSSWKRTKTRAARQPVPVIEEAARRILEWIEIRGESRWLFPQSTTDRPWAGGGPGYKPLDQIKSLGRRAGVNGVTMQSFRHTFATIAEIWGLSETQIQRILRHTTPLTQQHYRHSDRQVLAAIAKKISFDRETLLPEPKTETISSEGENSDGTVGRSVEPGTGNRTRRLALDATVQERRVAASPTAESRARRTSSRRP